jgi:hypothetical protein
MSYGTSNTHGLPKALSLEIRQTVLMLADQVIE